MTNPFPRNPAVIHQIQDALCAVQGDTVIREMIRHGAVYDLAGTIKMIKDQCRDGHRVAIVDMVGEKVVTLIDSI